MENTEKTNEKKVGRRLLISAIAVIVLAAVLLGVFYRVANQYKECFLPNTTINGLVCDHLTIEEVVVLLESQEQPYTLTVTGQDGIPIGVLTAEEMGLETVVVRDDIVQIMNQQNILRWPLAYLGRDSQSHTVLLETDYQEEMIVEALEDWPALNEANMEKPRDAYISEYLPEKKGYEMVAETQGNQLKVKTVLQEILSAVELESSELNLEEKCYINAKVTTQNRALNRRLDKLNRIVNTQIVYDWNGNEVVLDADTIHQWIVEENGNVKIDKEAVYDFVADQAKKYDTYGKNREFTTSLGETITVLNGGYGWRTDKEKETEELIALIEEGAVTEREPVYRYKGAQKGTDDIGNSYVEIDLSNQHLYLYYQGSLVLETDFVSGNMSNGNTTPGGLYGLTYKTTNAVLRGADYVTPVHYWMPFNGNIGMHDATWRSQFGGDIYLTDGSHGCINLPLDKAQAIYPYLSTGFPIICYYY